MTNHFSNPLNLLGTSQSGVYRPKYRVRSENPSHALEGSAGIKQPDIPGLMSALQALEQWRAEEDAREKTETARWHPEKAKSLTVYIAPPPDADWHSLILRACRDWEASAGGMVHFFASVRPDFSDIRIEWTQEAVTGRDYEVGHTRRSVQSQNWITQATITLLVQPEIDKHLQNSQIEQRLYTTLLHEVGHALGLEHSQSRKDVMHHRGWQNKQLSANDIRQLHELYTRPIQTLSWL